MVGQEVQNPKEDSATECGRDEGDVFFHVGSLHPTVGTASCRMLARPTPQG